MKLTTNYNDEVIDNPDDDAILNALVYTVEHIASLYGESVMLISESEDEGILLVQAMYDDDKPGWLLLVARSGEGEEQCNWQRAAEGPFPTTEIVEILRQYAKGDDSWQDGIHWEADRSMSAMTLGGIVLAVIIVALLIILFLMSR